MALLLRPRSWHSRIRCFARRQTCHRADRPSLRKVFPRSWWRSVRCGFHSSLGDPISPECRTSPISPDSGGLAVDAGYEAATGHAVKNFEALAGNRVTDPKGFSDDQLTQLLVVKLASRLSAKDRRPSVRAEGWRGCPPPGCTRSAKSTRAPEGSQARRSGAKRRASWHHKWSTAGSVSAAPAHNRKHAGSDRTPDRSIRSSVPPRRCCSYKWRS